MIVAVVGISFAAFTYTKAGETTNTISTGTITMSYTEGTNGISIENAIPMAEDAGKALNADNEKFDFTVSATITGKTAIDYVIVAKKDTTESTIEDKDIRLYLEESDTNGSGYSSKLEPTAFSATSEPKYGAEEGTMELATGTFSNKNGNGTSAEYHKYYRLRMWVDSAYVVGATSQKYKVTVNVYGKGQD